MTEADRGHGPQVETRELVVPRVTDAERAAALDDRDDREFYASQWQLMRRRFFRHKVALGAMIVLAVLYLAALFSPFLSPHDPVLRSLAYKEAPPMVVRLFEEGRLRGPFVYPLVSELDRETYENVYQEDRAQRYPVKLFVRGFEYKLFGLFPSDRHLFGTGVEGVPVHLFGTDSLGRDVFSRTLYGAQISLSVGLVGVAISFFLGILIGGVAGFFGGTVDEVIQRMIEIIIGIPSLPLWMGLSAALPTGWPVLKMYFAITVIVSLIGWTSLARVVRGKFLSLREEDFVVAAKLAGRRDVPTIFLHMVPSFLSHIIASLTLAIPTMILAETALSFLGLGMQPPAISWGVLLKAAQNVHSIALAPWLMIPGLFVIITVLAFNFVGDGLRDAADPYASH
ncbi:MAG: ABC transporter permease [Spirochaetaceae bacterium]|nr:ABC transporter permease [Spirochaetaceae bacterium]